VDYNLMHTHNVTMTHHDKELNGLIVIHREHDGFQGA